MPPTFPDLSKALEGTACSMSVPTPCAEPLAAVLPTSLGQWVLPPSGVAKAPATCGQRRFCSPRPPYPPSWASQYSTGLLRILLTYIAGGDLNSPIA